MAQFSDFDVQIFKRSGIQSFEFQLTNSKHSFSKILHLLKNAPYICNPKKMGA
jgi:hypothetical protein